jgi:hypothetical protein
MKPRNCTFVGAEIYDDGAGNGGDGIAAFVMQAGANCPLVGTLIDEAFAPPNEISCMARSGDRLYVATYDRAGQATIVTVDVSDPTAMTILSTVEAGTSGEPIALTMSGAGDLMVLRTLQRGGRTSRAYVWSRELYDLDDADHPNHTDVHTCTGEGPGGEEARDAEAWVGTRLYLWDLERGTIGTRGGPATLRCYDCSDGTFDALLDEQIMVDRVVNATVAASENYLAISYDGHADAEWYWRIEGWRSTAGEINGSADKLWVVQDASDRYGDTDLVALRGERVWRTVSRAGGVALQARSMTDGAIIAQSVALGWMLDHDVNDEGYAGVLMWFDPPPNVLPQEVWQAGDLDAAANLPTQFALRYAGYGWWPDGWFGTPETRDYAVAAEMAIVPGVPIVRRGDALDVYTDGMGTQWTVVLNGNSLQVWRRESTTPSEWQLMSVVDSSGDYDSPRITGDDRLYTVVARDAQTHEFAVWDSQDGGETWDGPHTAADVTES